MSDLPGVATHVTAAATAVAFAGRTTLHKVVVGKAVASATLKLHDCAAGADVSAGNMIATIELDTRGFYEFESQCALGLVYVLSATADVTIIHG